MYPFVVPICPMRRVLIDVPHHSDRVRIRSRWQATTTLTTLWAGSLITKTVFCFYWDLVHDWQLHIPYVSLLREPPP